MLDAGARSAVHQGIVDHMLERRSINADDANTILAHAIAGHSAHGILALSTAVLKAEDKERELLAEQFFILPILTTARPLFPENRAVSVILRLAQFRLIVVKDDTEDIRGCVQALLNEIAGEQREDIRSHLESMGLAIVLNTLGIAAHVSNWMYLLRRFREVVEVSATLQASKGRLEAAGGGGTFYGNLFSIGTGNLPTTLRLEQIFDELDALSSEERAVWLASFEESPHDYAVLVNPAWSNEQRRQGFDAPRAAQRFKRLSEMAHRWGVRTLALQCVSARAVMLDEYMDDANAAHAAIDEGIALLGDDTILQKAHARMYWRHRDYAQAVEIFRAIADRVGRPSAVDRAFTLREAAISAAYVDEWSLAAAWFGEAEQAVASLDVGDMPTMAIGLQADRAVALYRAGDIQGALRAMEHCVDRLGALDADATVRAGSCHRLVRHAVLWLDTQLEGRDTKINGEPIGMLPGACSTPDPPAAIVDRPCGPLDLAWYMLAGAEISARCDVGIAASFRAKLRNGPIQFFEVSIRKRLITTDIRSTNAVAFAAHLNGYLAGVDLLGGQGAAARANFDIMNPPRGEVPPLAVPYSDSSEMIAREAIIAFELTAYLEARADQVVELRTALEATLGADFPGRSAFENRGDDPANPLDSVVLTALATRRSGAHIEPRALWEIGLRLFERARQSGFKGNLVPLVARWMRARSRAVIDNESFRLIRPMVAVPALESRLATQQNDEAFVASFLLESADAVGSPLSVEYMKLLRDLSGREPQTASDA
jgi:hypothetical protein